MDTLSPLLNSVFANNSTFRVVRLRHFQSCTDKLGNVLKSPLSTPEVVYLCYSKSNKQTNYTWLSAKEEKRYTQTHFVERKSRYELEKLIGDNHLIFQIVEKLITGGDSFTYGQCFIVDIHSGVQIKRTRYDEKTSQYVEEFLYTKEYSDYGGDATSVIPFQPLSETYYWAEGIEPQTFNADFEPYFSFICEYLYLHSGGFFDGSFILPDQYSIFTVKARNPCLTFKRTDAAITFCQAAKEASLLQPSPNASETPSMTTNSSNWIAQQVALESEEDFLQNQTNLTCWEDFVSPPEERIVESLLSETNQESLEEWNKENVDPILGLESPSFDWVRHAASEQASFVEFAHSDSMLISDIPGSPYAEAQGAPM